MEMGERIKRLREQLGMTPAALARRVGISAAHMSQVESGKSGVSVPVQRAIAEALAVSTDVLNGDAPMPDEKVHKAKKRMAFLLEEVRDRESATGIPPKRTLYGAYSAV